MEKFYTLKEVSDTIKIPENTIRIWLRSGRIEGVKIGRHWRITETALEKFLKEHTGGGKQ